MKNFHEIFVLPLVKRRYPDINTNTSVHFIECTEIIWKTLNVNGLCIPVFLNQMRWYLVVIVKLHNDECLIYIFTGKVENGTLVIFNKTVYHSW